jgi:2,4-dienoyl-CoA reductase-like NADH-dependent reductase (Old Yellow Enzyme family)
MMPIQKNNHAENRSPALFSPLPLRGLTLKNRIAVSPMCQYSCTDGFVSDWHLVHLGSRAIGGAALVMVEATAVEARGRISPADAGIWKDGHVEALARVAGFVKAQGAAPAIQLAHAGRKASTREPWNGGGVITERDGGWQAVGPCAEPFQEGDPPPRALERDEIRGIIDAFAAGARRALAAGFEVVEIHGAHGYLIHEFLSPLVNFRKDEYGGSFDGRTRLAREVAQAVREIWPRELPVFMRLSCSDWVEGGWDIDQSVELSRRLRVAGVDLIDCSSGGTVPGAKVPAGPGYQVPFAARIRREAGIATGAVGMITEPHQAESIVGEGQADLVLLARAMLRDPYWAIHAAQALGRRPDVPVQYLRAF